MFLAITTLNQHACWQDFLCQINDLEQAFAFLDLIVSKGDTLIKACITDQESTLRIPVEAFDGQPINAPIALLKEEWERVLAQPLTLSEQPPATQELHQRLLIARQTKEVELHRKLDIMQRLLQYTQDCLLEGNPKQRLIRHYQAIIDQTTESLHKLHRQFSLRKVY